MFSGSNRVRITTLGSCEIEMPGRLDGSSGDRINLITARSLPLGASIRVDGEGLVLLGEVCHSQPHGAEFVASLKIEHLMADAHRESMVLKVRRATVAQV